MVAWRLLAFSIGLWVGEALRAEVYGPALAQAAILKSLQTGQPTPVAARAQS